MNFRPGALLLAPAALLTFVSPAAADPFDGPHFGASAGYHRDEVGPQLGDDVELPRELTQDSAYFQLFAGYDLAVAPKVRLGVEAAIGLGAEDELVLRNDAGQIEIDPEYTFEATGRLGYLVSDKAMLYVRGGYQNSRIEASFTPAGQSTTRDKDNADGWLVGGGGEYAFTDNLRTRIEYRYADLGNDGARWDRHQVLAGVLWSF